MTDEHPQPEPTDTVVSVRGATKVFKPRRRAPVHALRGIDLDVARGEYVSIMGPSGSGKSTLFNLIGALDTPTAGDVKIGGLSLPGLSQRQLAYVRCRSIGYVFQAYNLIPALSALKNVALPAVFRGLPLDEADALAARRLEQVGLAHRLDHRPDALSGGQQQRVAIARALVNGPAVLLADEPTANLDLDTGAEVIALFHDLTRTSGVTVISTTHDHQMLAKSDRVVWIRDGAIDRVAAADELDIAAGSISAGG